MARSSHLISTHADLKGSLSSDDEDKLVKELRQIKSKRSPRQLRIRKTLDVLKNATSSRVRNAAAIALADMNSVEAKRVLIDLLTQPATRNARGTLLYALDELGAKIPADVLVELILHDSYEARQEAVNLIEKGRSVWNGTSALQVAQKLEVALSSPDEELQEAATRVVQYISSRDVIPNPVSSATYRLFERAMRSRKQVVCIYDGYPRELSPVILGHSQGQEKALTYQFGGQSKSGLPKRGEWRCLWLAKVRDVQLRDGPWFTGPGHTVPQGCVEIVDLDVNPSSPYHPKRTVSPTARRSARRRAAG